MSIITVKSEVIFHPGLISKVGQTAKCSTIDTLVSAVKRWIVLKIGFSFLNFWSVKLASTCLPNCGRIARSHALFMIKQRS